MKKFFAAVFLFCSGLGALAQTSPTAIEVANLTMFHAGAFGVSVHMQGNVLAGDGGEGYFLKTGTSCVADDVTYVKDRTNACFQRQNSPILTVTPQMFGAACNATSAAVGTDDFVAIKAMMDSAHLSGAQIVFPAGTACRIITGTRAASLPFYSGQRIGGSGTLYYDDGGVNWGAFAASGVSDVQFRDFHCVGTWALLHVQSGGSCIDATGTNISVENINCKNISRWCVNCPGCSNLRAVNNYVDSAAGGGFVCFGCYNWTISYNRIYHTGDNAIAASQEPNQAEPLGGVGMIDHNILYDTVGIENLGGKVSVITNNTLFRNKSLGIMADYAGSFSEGETSEHTLIVSNNSISDMVSVDPNGNPFTASCLLIGSFGQAGSHTLPWKNNTGTGTVQTPWPYAWTNGQLSANTTVEPGHGNIISNNSCGRSLPGTGNYSTAGFNPTGTTDGAKLFTIGAYTDPALTDDFYQARGLTTGDYLTNTIISNNYFQPGITCWLMKPIADLSYRDVRFDGNKCVDAIGNGISQSIGGALQVGVTFKNNEFNCDPFFKATLRAVGGHGKWQDGVTPVAFDANDMKGLMNGGGNSYKNCLQTIRTNFPIAQSAPDIVQANPVALGSNVDNIGIRYIPQGLYHYIILDGDPTSATYDQILNDNATTATTIPVAGTWIKGVFVTDVSGSACAAGKQSLGWSRLTTGTANVSGTDWLPVTVNC